MLGIARCLRELRTSRTSDPGDLLARRRTDVVDALAGADDFIVKPIPEKDELAARVVAAAAVLSAGTGKAGTSISPVRIDLTARSISKSGAPIELKTASTNFASCCFRHLNGVISAKIIHTLWGNVPLDGSRSLDARQPPAANSASMPGGIRALQSVYGRRVSVCRRTGRAVFSRFGCCRKPWYSKRMEQMVFSFVTSVRQTRRHAG